MALFARERIDHHPATISVLDHLCSIRTAGDRETRRDYCDS